MNISLPMILYMRYYDNTPSNKKASQKDVLFLRESINNSKFKGHEFTTLKT